MSAETPPLWTIAQTVEIAGGIIRGEVPVSGDGPAGYLAWLMVQLGATVQITPPGPQPEPAQCRRCDRPADLHCPGCATCWPDDTCSLLCDAEPEDLDRVVGAIEDWQEQRDAIVSGAP